MMRKTKKNLESRPDPAVMSWLADREPGPGETVGARAARRPSDLQPSETKFWKMVMRDIVRDLDRARPADHDSRALIHPLLATARAAVIAGSIALAQPVEAVCIEQAHGEVVAAAVSRDRRCAGIGARSFILLEDSDQGLSLSYDECIHSLMSRIPDLHLGSEVVVTACSEPMLHPAK